MVFNVLQYLGERWGKARDLALFADLMQRLGNPQNSFRVIHVAGSNGKGSTCVFLESILREAGFHTGLYTSPALVRVNERMRIGGKMVSDETLDSAARRVAEAEKASGVEYGGFDRMTATALLIFEQMNVEIAVLETGLGGRLDATNICDSELAVLTAIDFDHTRILGERIEDIAREKCAIIKPGQRVVIAHPQQETVREMIQARCEQAHTLLIQVSDCEIRVDQANEFGQKFRIAFPDGISMHFHISLMGRHQRDNACAAVLAARALQLDAIAIARGLQSAVWPGRLELLDGSPPVLLDGAHNPHAMKSLVDAVQAYFSDRRIILITAMMADKDIEPMLVQLAGVVQNAIAVPLGERSIDPVILAERLGELGVKSQTQRSFAQAFVEALGICDQCHEDNPLVLVTGSLYLVGVFRAFIKGEDFA